MSARIHIAASGKVTSSRRLGSTLADATVTSCLVTSLTRLSLPKARRGSTARVDIQVSAGDTPMQRPDAAPQPDRPGRRDKTDKETQLEADKKKGAL